ncbi:MAG: hypothetical protein RL172_1843 [Bacteroidota bacterium]|jgi:NAD(P)-dependent dehydrogenase (short-subunit alcohol dehydrogenase family)
MTTKIALVTGGSRGLGKEMALSLAQKGIDVLLTWKNNEAQAKETAAAVQQLGAKAATLQLDMLQPAGLNHFIMAVKNTLQQHWGKQHIDFLINNAGMGATIPFTEVTEKTFDEFMDVHFKGVYFLTQKMLPLLNDGGSIINISSGTTRFCVPGYSVYASMKGAIETFTKYLAKELGHRQITANIVAPGPVETDFNEAAIRNNPQMKAALSNFSPLGRVGHADDIGGVVAFLCSHEAKWINGQRIEVSGGINI